MKKLAAITAAVLTLSLAACGGGKDGITEVDTLEGAYVLKTVNNTPLPFVGYEEPGYKLEIISSTWTLTAGGTFTSVATWRETESGAVTTTTETSNGTFTANGPNLSFVSPGGDLFTGTRVGKTLTLTFDEGMVAVYVK